MAFRTLLRIAALIPCLLLVTALVIADALRVKASLDGGVIKDIRFELRATFVRLFLSTIFDGALASLRHAVAVWRCPLIGVHRLFL